MRHLTRLAGAIVLLLPAMALSEGTAFAHVVYQGGKPYVSSFDCMDVYAEISDGTSSTGFNKTTITSEQLYNPPVGGSQQCAQYFPRPAGNLEAKFDNFKLVSGNWAICTATAWTLNTAEADVMTLQSYGADACGPGTYSTTGYGDEYNDGWHGGGVWSGSHDLS